MKPKLTQTESPRPLIPTDNNKADVTEPRRQGLRTGIRAGSGNHRDTVKANT